MTTDLRSVLFVPGDRPQRIPKAYGSGADAIVVDLEDAVAADNKGEARALLPLSHSIRGTLSPSIIVRINGSGTQWHDDDLRAVGSLPPPVGILLPKAEPSSLHKLLQRPECAGRAVYALIETALGLARSREMACLRPLSGFMFGNIDFSRDCGLEPSEDEIELSMARSMLVLASREARLPAPIDGVCLDIHDVSRVSAHAKRAKRMGFGGVLCIHPLQVAAVNQAFGTTHEEIVWAQRVLAGYDAAGGSVFALDGRMIDKPVADRARQLFMAQNARSLPPTRT